MSECESWPGPAPNPYTYYSPACGFTVEVDTPYTEGWSCARWVAEHTANIRAATEECPPG